MTGIHPRCIPLLAVARVAAWLFGRLFAHRRRRQRCGDQLATLEAESSHRRLDHEFQRLEENAKHSSQGQFEQAKQWRFANLTLGVTASVLAAISGATALSITNGRLIIGFAALAAAGLGAALSTLNAGHRTERATAAANEYLAVQTRARQTRLIDLPTLSVDDARARLRDLTDRLEEQNKSAEPVNRRAYKKAYKNIHKEKGQEFDVDRE